MTRQYSREENNLILDLYQRGIAPSEIAARTGIKASTIKTKLQSWKVPAQIRPAKIDPVAAAYAQIDKLLPREDQFAEMLAQGYGVGEIGRVMGYKNYDSANAAFQRLRRHVGRQAR